MDEFVQKLGQSKKELLDAEYTMIHNETFMAIGKKAGPEGAYLWLILNSYCYGKKKVASYRKNVTMQDDTGASKSTLERWKNKLKLINAIKVIPCKHPDGSSTSNVILLNATWPEIPDGWESYAPNGYVMFSGKPVLFEDYKNMEAEILNNRRKSRNNRGVKNDTLPVPEMTPSPYQKWHGGGTKNDTPSKPENPRHTRDLEAFLEGEEDNTRRQYKKTNRTTTTTETKDVVVPDKLVELLTQLKRMLGSLPNKQKLTELINSHTPKELIIKAEETANYANKHEVGNIVGLWINSVENDYSLSQWVSRGFQVGRPSAPANKYSEFYKLFPDG